MKEKNINKGEEKPKDQKRLSEEKLKELKKIMKEKRKEKRKLNEVSNSRRN